MTAPRPTAAQLRLLRLLADHDGHKERYVILSFRYGWRIQWRVLKASIANGWVRAALGSNDDEITDAGRAALTAAEEAGA